MVRSRQRGPALPEDPTEEELARDWTLLEADRVQVLRCRGGEDNRRRFALQLCTLRQYGRFLVDYTSVPVRILNHIGRQLDLAPAFSVPEPERSATETAHQQRIRDYLRYRAFDQEARGLLEEHLRTQLAQGRLHQDLLTSAEDALLLWKVLLPPQSTLGRLGRCRPRAASAKQPDAQKDCGERGTEKQPGNQHRRPQVSRRRRPFVNGQAWVSPPLPNRYLGRVAACSLILAEHQRARLEAQTRSTTMR